MYSADQNAASKQQREADPCCYCLHAQAVPDPSSMSSMSCCAIPGMTDLIGSGYMVTPQTSVAGNAIAHQAAHTA